MSDLPVLLYSSDTVRAIDRHAIDTLGVQGFTLMLRAAQAAFDDATQRYPDAKRWQVFAGNGNNGGDGFLMATLAIGASIDVTVIELGDQDRLSSDAQAARQAYLDVGGAINRWSGDLDSAVDLYVDAMLGIGLTRELAGDYRAIAVALNAIETPVHALDVPTGIDADTGTVLGAAVRADMTSTFVRLKAGMLMGEARDYVGELRFDDLEIGDDDIGDDAAFAPLYERIAVESVAATLGPRRFDGHKGDFGHVLVVGGGLGMPGAAALCGEAALRSGAGRVTVATHPANVPIVAARRPELMVQSVAYADDLKALLGAADVVAFGPGLGQSEWAEGLFELLCDDNRPSVWDADALRLLAASSNKAVAGQARRIITPHPGEAAALLKTDIARVQADRISAVQQLANEYSTTALLKGSGSLVMTPGAALPKMTTAGNPGMATAGMGDVLTGLIAALLAQGLDVESSASLGVEVHARAGDIAAIGGQRGLIASDVLMALREVING